MSDKKQYGVGVDLGTMNIVSARQGDKGIDIRRIRDAFLDLDLSAKKMLKLSGIDFIERENEILLIGDAALETANVFGQEARRPLSQGLISAGEIDAIEVLGILVRHVLGEPSCKDEVCYFSIPAAPVDDLTRDVIYHEGVFERIVSECGFDAVASNEAMAIIFSECAQEGFSGLSISFGAGMCNIALAVNTIEGLCFSVARGGDWIDAGSAKATGSTRSKITTIKESGFDLLNPKSREEEALAVYYKSLIKYCLKHIANEFRKISGKFSLPKPIPLVISGGTSKAGGFVEFFQQVFEEQKKRFPIEISEIRQAKDPLNAVALGLCIQAQTEYDED